MSTGSELMLADYWVENTLITDSTLNNYIGRAVFNGLAPDNQRLPLVVYESSTGVDTPTLGVPGRLGTTIPYTIRVLTGSLVMAAVKPIVDRLDFLMENEWSQDTVILNDGSVWTYQISSFREQPFSMNENSRGFLIYHRGGIYSVTIQATRLA